MNDDVILLQRFVQSRSETAFAQLVERHINLVYSVAHRQLAGDVQRAEDATQAVFCELARKAPKLLAHRTLSGWLYQTSRFIAARLQRGETRRAAREQAYVMNEPQTTSPPELAWQDVGVVLDDAMGELPDQDRVAVILCYFQNKPFAEIGQILGLSENAVRMRVERALEKLRGKLSRRGIKSTSAVLGVVLAANAIGPAPAGLAAALLGPSLAAAAAATTTAGALSTLNLFGLMTIPKLQTGIVALALATTATTYFASRQTLDELRGENTRLRLSADARARHNVDAGGSAPPMADAAELERLRAEHAELLKLRGEVAQLRRQTAEMSRAAAAAPRSNNQPANHLTEAQREEMIKNLGLAKLNYSRAWGLAFQLYAEANQGNMPVSFADAVKWLPEFAPEQTWMTSMTGAQDFEIVYRGSLSDIENPAQAIVMREKEAYHVDDAGVAWRTYLFADGHTEIHKSKNGDFGPWESQRVPRLRSPQGTAGAQ